MNKIELTRVEFRWLLAAIMLVPVTLFAIGLNVGLGLHTGDESAVEMVAQSEPLAIPDLAAKEITQVTVEDVAKLEEVVAEMTASLEIEPVAEVQRSEIEIAEVAPVEEELAPMVSEVSESIEPVVEQVVAAPEVIDDLYGVQVGSFSKLENAQGLQQTMVKRGYDAQLVNDGIRYRVVIATYTTKDEAKQAEQVYESQNHADAYVTTMHQRDVVMTVAAVAG